MHFTGTKTIIHALSVAEFGSNLLPKKNAPDVLGQGGRCAGSRSLHSGDMLEKLPEQCSHLGDTSVDGPGRPKNYSEGGAYCSVYLVPVSCFSYRKPQTFTFYSFCSYSRPLVGSNGVNWGCRPANPECVESRRLRNGR